MNVEVEMSKVVPVAQMKGDNEEETAGLLEMFVEAKNYLQTFPWVREVKAAYLGIGVAKIVGIFLFEIVPSREDVDDRVWVIVGDLPPAYITAEDSPNPAAALDAYIGAMEQWVEAAKAGRSVKNLIPVNVPPTLENAARLESRLSFLDREILSKYPDDLAD